MSSGRASSALVTTSPVSAHVVAELLPRQYCRSEKPLVSNTGSSAKYTSPKFSNPSSARVLNVYPPLTHSSFEHDFRLGFNSTQRHSTSRVALPGFSHSIISTNTFSTCYACGVRSITAVSSITLWPFSTSPKDEEILQLQHLHYLLHNEGCLADVRVHGPLDSCHDLRDGIQKTAHLVCDNPLVRCHLLVGCFLKYTMTAIFS